MTTPFDVSLYEMRSSLEVAQRVINEFDMQLIMGSDEVVLSQQHALLFRELAEVGLCRVADLLNKAIDNYESCRT